MRQVVWLGLVMCLAGCGPAAKEAAERQAYVSAMVENITDIGRVSGEYGTAAQAWAVQPNDPLARQNMDRVRGRFTEFQSRAQAIEPHVDFVDLHQRYLALLGETRATADNFESAARVRDLQGILRVGPQLAKLQIDFNELGEAFQVRLKQPRRS